MRKEIFRGPLGSVAGISSLGFDAELRFIIALARDQAVGTTRALRFENQVGSSPQCVIDPAAFPEINEMRGVARYNHELLGRAWTFEVQVGFQLQMILVDGNNDGAFDGPPLIGDYDYFAAAGIERDWDLWDFLDGTP